jgi:hypothetical protein
MSITMPDERTLADIRMDALRNQAKLSIYNPKIEPNIAGTDVSAAQAKHDMNMLLPKYPQTLASVAETGNYPSSAKGLQVADIYALLAPEGLLTTMKELPGDELTTRSALAMLEEMWWDTEVMTPSIYRYTPEFMKLKTQLFYEARILLNRNVPGPNGEPNERGKQWHRPMVSKVEHSFEEIRPRPQAAPQKGSFIRWPFGKKR